MNIENINNQKILTPKENMCLCNKNAQVISDKVYLGINAPESDWEEIPEDEKQILETLWNGETISDTDEATTSDLYNALAELGVE